MSTHHFRIAIQLVLCQVFHGIVTQECDGEYSVHGMMLKEHVYKTLKTSISLDCLLACNDDIKCQSFNYVISRDVCELNNRTKEARPDDYAPDPDRLYSCDRATIAFFWKTILPSNLLGPVYDSKIEKRYDVTSLTW